MSPRRDWAAHALTGAAPALEPVGLASVPGAGGAGRKGSRPDAPGAQASPWLRQGWEGGGRGRPARDGPPGPQVSCPRSGRGPGPATTGQCGPPSVSSALGSGGDAQPRALCPALVEGDGPQPPLRAHDSEQLSGAATGLWLPGRGPVTDRPGAGQEPDVSAGAPPPRWGAGGHLSRRPRASSDGACAVRGAAGSRGPGGRGQPCPGPAPTGGLPRALLPLASPRRGPFLPSEETL